MCVTFQLWRLLKFKKENKTKKLRPDLHNFCSSSSSSAAAAACTNKTSCVLCSARFHSLSTLHSSHHLLMNTCCLQIGPFFFSFHLVSATYLTSIQSVLLNFSLIINITYFSLPNRPFCHVVLAYDGWYIDHFEQFIT